MEKVGDLNEVRNDAGIAEADIQIARRAEGITLEKFLEARDSLEQARIRLVEGYVERIVLYFASYGVAVSKPGIMTVKQEADEGWEDGDEDHDAPATHEYDDGIIWLGPEVFSVEQLDYEAMERGVLFCLSSLIIDEAWGERWNPSRKIDELLNEGNAFDAFETEEKQRKMPEVALLNSFRSGAQIFCEIMYNKRNVQDKNERSREILRAILGRMLGRQDSQINKVMQVYRQIKRHDLRKFAIGHDDPELDEDTPLLALVFAVNKYDEKRTLEFLRQVPPSIFSGLEAAVKELKEDDVLKGMYETYNFEHTPPKAGNG